MRTALVVIDMQNGFVRTQSRAVVSRVVQLVELCDARNLDIVFTRFKNRRDSPYRRLMDWHGVQASPDIDIVPELAGRAQVIVDKHGYSAFTPEFEALVQDRVWQRLLLCGIATEACVLKTAVDAFERGLTPLVVTDACASDGGADAHDAGLIVLRRCIGARQLLASSQVRDMLDADC